MSDVAFILLDVSSSLVEEWRNAFGQHLQPKDLERFTFLERRLNQVHATFDCVVSPANSYGILDGGFDLRLSQTFSPPDDVRHVALTRLVQAAIRKRYYGFAPPGSCTLVPGLPPNPFGCKTIAVCPTMRIPEVLTWHKDIVYNTMWSLLVELEHWNENAVPGEENKIRKVLMSGLGTGTGNISAADCARQMAVAVKHFLYARKGQDEGEGFSWDEALHLAQEF